MDKRACGDDLDAEVETARADLEAEWTDEVLRAAIRACGYRDRAPARPTPSSVRPRARS